MWWADLQDLDGGNLLRFDWFTIFLLFIVLCLVTVAIVTGELMRARTTACLLFALSVTRIALALDNERRVTHGFRLILLSDLSGARLASRSSRFWRWR